MTILSKVTVGEAAWLALRDKVEKLNKRAARHNMNMLSLRVLSIDVVERNIGFGKTIPVTQYEVEIEGNEPCINGWRLIARVEFNDTVGCVVHIAPGNDDDGSFEKYRTVGPVCEHCNTSRRRKDVFVLEGPNGQRKVIGRNCLADYLRCGDANTLAVWAEIVESFNFHGGDANPDELGGYDYRSGNGNPTLKLEGYLRVVAVAKRVFGWMGRTAARDSYDGIATADMAARIIYGSGSRHEAWLRENNLFSCDEDKEYVEKAIEWACELDDKGNEYKATIKAIACAGEVDMRTLDGYAASILIAYDKAREREIEYARKNANSKNKVWLGCEKKREKGLRVTCVGVNTFEGYYGTTTLVRFEHDVNDNDKAVLVWFASGDQFNDWESGKDYVIDATVKGHDDHEKYGKQTKINRVKGCAA